MSTSEDLDRALEAFMFRSLRSKAIDLGLLDRASKPSDAFELLDALAFHDSVKPCCIDSPTTSGRVCDMSGLSFTGIDTIFEMMFRESNRLSGAYAFDKQTLNTFLEQRQSVFRLVKIDVECDSENKQRSDWRWKVTAVYLKLTDNDPGTLYPGTAFEVPVV